MFCQVTPPSSLLMTPPLMRPAEILDAAGWPTAGTTARDLALSAVSPPFFSVHGPSPTAPFPSCWRLNIPRPTLPA